MRRHGIWNFSKVVSKIDGSIAIESLISGSGSWPDDGFYSEVRTSLGTSLPLIMNDIPIETHIAQQIFGVIGKVRRP